MSLPEAEVDDLKNVPEQENGQQNASEPHQRSVTEADIQELYRRAQLALNSGYTVARADDWAAEVGAADGSPQALVDACEIRLGVGLEDESAGEETPTMPPSRSEAVAEAVAAEGGPLPEEPTEAEPIEASEEEEAGSTDSPYESWNKKSLVAEAEARGLEVKGNMTKAEIIAMLRA